MSYSKVFPLLLFFLFISTFKGNTQDNIKDKTLVVWAYLDNLQQRGGSALTLDDGNGSFDGIVFAELRDSCWMAGSNNWQRTQEDQSAYLVEGSGPEDLVRISIVYKGQKIKIFHNNELSSEYDIDEVLEFNRKDLSIIFGRRHLDAGDPENSFTGRIKEARVYIIALNDSDIYNLKPGFINKDKEPWLLWDFGKHGLQDAGRVFTEFSLSGSAYLSDGCLVLEGNGASFIVSGSDLESPGTDFSQIPKSLIRDTRLFREKLLSDPYRPAYHFCIPEGNGMPGDPNGAFYHNGRYHLMYLYNREESGFCWGHISSRDLVHWIHHPDAIGPGNGDEGCFSGGGFVDEDGTAYLTYWMLWGDKGIGIAKSTDESYSYWEKFDNNPVIKSTEWGLTEFKDENGNTITIGSADPSNIWKKDGKYYMLCGNLLVLNKLGREDNSPENEKGDRLYLFESDDLVNWSYVHRFYESNRVWTEASEDNMCPSFFPLPGAPEGGPPSDKHLMVFISHNKGCQYYIGDYRANKFTPGKHGRMTWIDNEYFAPEALMDEHGRQIMWAWIFDGRPEKLKKQFGWTGTYGLPRSLWLNEDGELGIQPVEELKMLRMNEISLKDIHVDKGLEINLDSLGSELMEIELTINTDEIKELNIDLCRSENGEEKTSVIYSNTKNTISIDTRSSSIEYGKKIIETAPLALNQGENLHLRIFIDRSVIEVFANDRQAVARRIYPTLGGKGIRIYSDGPCNIISLKKWDISPSNPY